ncbi:M48 family metallopeptidase [Opitutaceae bacterium]
MDFFEAQARAKKQTTRLVGLFVLAVTGTIAAGYFAALLVLGQVNGRVDRSGPYEVTYTADGAQNLWQPGVLATVTVVTIAIVGLASLFKWLSLRQGGPAVAEMVGGRRANPQTTDLRERQLLNVVEEMAIASGVPMPAVYILDEEPALNAFAAGLGTSDAVVAVTRGSLEKLTRDELQAVVGHEFSHILNGDMRLNLRLTAILFGILVIALIGRGVLQGMGRTRVRSGHNKNAGGAIALMLAVGLALMLVGYVGYFFGRLIQAAVSRQREYLADASAVQFTRNPNGIVGALKKIGGYALGGSITARHAVEIRHFFFAQGFRSAFNGLFATHPPLIERIRAVDASFDGKFFEPETVVDVQHESFQTAGFARRSTANETAAQVFAAAANLPPPLPPRTRPAFEPAAVIRTIGQPGPAHVIEARQILARLPARLREAARDPAQAPALVFGLVLAPDPSLRARQLALVATQAGGSYVQTLAELDPSLRQLGNEGRLPLLQLTLPALCRHDANAIDRFVTTLDELVHADQSVSVFEYALQKLLIHHLQLHRAPAGPRATLHTFTAAADSLALVLSALAWQGSRDERAAQASFSSGAAGIPSSRRQIQLLPRDRCGLDQLDAALDHLALASGAIKQGLLTAAGRVVASDSKVTVEETELLRAIAAVLDCPLPPVL